MYKFPLNFVRSLLECRYLYAHTNTLMHMNSVPKTTSLHRGSECVRNCVLFSSIYSCMSVICRCVRVQFSTLSMCARVTYLYVNVCLFVSSCIQHNTLQLHTERLKKSHCERYFYKYIPCCQ